MIYLFFIAFVLLVCAHGFTESLVGAYREGRRRKSMPPPPSHPVWSTYPRKVRK